jgi:hypothetical protein
MGSCSLNSPVIGGVTGWFRALTGIRQAESEGRLSR